MVLDIPASGPSSYSTNFGAGTSSGKDLRRTSTSTAVGRYHLDTLSDGIPFSAIIEQASLASYLGE